MWPLAHSLGKEKLWVRMPGPPAYLTLISTHPPLQQYQPSCCVPASGMRAPFPTQGNQPPALSSEPQPPGLHGASLHHQTPSQAPGSCPSAQISLAGKHFLDTWSLPSGLG